MATVARGLKELRKTQELKNIIRGRFMMERLREGDIVQHFKREMVEDKEHNMEYIYT